ncbi:Ca2+-dependent phosphoinositide-specific phospholipase C [uncultured Psychrosphaera sp.]|uniref:Ca2+-dependent phosphoinositide-specific phospholipase C n=1 Tax=uncultured Psychrosphaera sp. TaxID=1403522 RepID=UPI002610A2EE|nr:Ca2+-dependent phosphoinositide-specific phospholipase C [uncultured Psychrosphaera sp.]
MSKAVNSEIKSTVKSITKLSVLFIVLLITLVLFAFTNLLNCTFLQTSTLNDFQVIGSHNSYKRLMPKQMMNYIAGYDSRTAENINYYHDTLTAQLDLGLRHLEIDVLLDPDGGKFSQPSAESIINKPLLNEKQRQQLKQKGLKVLHIPDIDFLSHCTLFTQCLEQLLHWSENNPKHFPVTILLNVKESKAKFVDGVSPLTFTQNDYTALDNEIKKVLTTEKLITPDVIRGELPSLEQAILTNGWPSIESLKGQFLFVFDGNSRQRDLYRKDHPSLSERVMFASFEPGQPEAAYLIMNDPIKQFNQIKQRVEQGYMVRTRADANLSNNNSQRTKRRQAAFNSGAQVISTDFYSQSPQSFTSGYQVIFKHKKYIRNNQITTAQTNGHNFFNF